ncbi:MAG: hypothetical protein QOF33_966 [Thermomicrobiales bacterium]|nr:hypothetical protein [Thermomicrobiales bacterium]
MEPEPDSRFAAKILLGTIFGFHLVVVGLVLGVARSAEAQAYAAATAWHLSIPPVVLAGGWLLFRYRLHRVRAKRHRLLQEEWSLGSTRRGNTVPVAELSRRLASVAIPVDLVSQPASARTDQASHQSVFGTREG